MADELVRTNRLVTVFGGSGFIGRHVVRALARDGWRVRVATRRPDLAFHLQPLGKVGQITPVQANLRYPDSIVHALRDAQAVVNLVGILSETGEQKFDAVHADGVKALAKAAKAGGASAFVQISAIGADPDSASAYARSKARGEAAAREAFPEAVILRPSVVFGPEDHFFNRFAAMARYMPALPLIGEGKTKLQPVFVGDVAKAVALAVEGKTTQGAIYELGGPEVATLKRILEFVLKITERKRFLAPISFAQAKTIGGLTETLTKLSLGLFPEMFAITSDQVELLKTDNVVSAAAIADKRTLQGLGITPESFEAFVPTYLGRYRATGQFADRRAA
ncbi:Complex I NDUFA9 subunit family protein [Methylocella tundrae]|uniref:Complex I NDUFA9 subunit family protein n=1 Tax=Methylocella tundrae TaxID=227605 RepID=A0A8B6M3R8_METTU|nr:complex I NDUFA9 subunit family protein [Methylocella tundrae]VTZ28434.1 Complex I NDUFA9 subunit family protein [Methylocella tundrae]VTZ49023.1 Complex I NDUFA9 subunit family protein [Methylocella tundrae]